MPRRALAVLSQPDETTLEDLVTAVEENTESIVASNVPIETAVKGIKSNTSKDGPINTQLKSIDEELKKKR